MSRLLLTYIFTLLICVELSAQNRTEDFEITLPEQKVQGSLYKTINFLDSRYDTTYMGIVQLGAFNKKAKVVSGIPFSSQLKTVINSIIDADAGNGELLFQLRQFNFAEITGAMSEKGYCYLKAELYSKSGSQYQNIASIDTVILVKSMDVTRALFRNGSKTITKFIGDNLLKEAPGLNYYSFNNIVNIDSIEKRNIILYNTAKYSEGLYDTYASFKKQAPDAEVKVEMKGEKISSVKAPDKNGKG
ncbi:MAG: hypothetical protein ABIO81_05665 [Ginsengibacter sp.]